MRALLLPFKGVLLQMITVFLQLAQLLPYTLNPVHMRPSMMAELVRARARDFAIVEQHALVQAWQLIKIAVLRRLLAAGAARVAADVCGHGVVVS